MITNSKGFTLIEFMIACVILSIAVLALASLQIAALEGNARAQRMTTAASVAEHTLEQLKDTPYDDILSVSATSMQASGLTFTRQVTVTPDPLVANSKTVQITVSWTKGAKTYTVPLTTTIAR